MNSMSGETTGTGRRAITTSICLISCIAIFTLNTGAARAAERCVDFDEMAPVWTLKSSQTDASGVYSDYLSLATDGAVIVYRSSNKNALEASRLTDGEPLWLFETAGEVNSRPVIFNGMVFFGSDDGYLYALDERTGHLIWKFDGRREKSVVDKAAKKGRSLFGGLDLNKLKKAKKEITEKEYEPNNLRTRPALAGGVLAMYVPKNKIVGIDHPTGEKLWETEMFEGKEPWYSSMFPGDVRDLPIPEIISDGEKFYTGFGGILSFDARTGVKTILWPPQGGDRLKEYEKWTVSDIILADTVIVAAAGRDGVIAIRIGGGSPIWHLDTSILEGSYESIEADDTEGVALVKDKGAVCFGLGDGVVKWVAEVTGAQRSWLGTERVYVISMGNQVHAFDRETGGVVWEKDFTRSQVSELYGCRGALVFGCTEGKGELRILSTEPRAAWVMMTYGRSLSEDQPAHVIRKVLKAGYPGYYTQNEQVSFGVFENEALREVSKHHFSSETYPVYGAWCLARQEIEGDSARVHVVVKKTADKADKLRHPLLEPEWGELTFNLKREDGRWLVAQPVPDVCEIDTVEVHPLFLDTPGVAAHPSGGSRACWPLAVTPGDHWVFRTLVQGDMGDTTIRIEGEGHLVVEAREVSADKSVTCTIRQISWAQSPEALGEWYQLPRMDQPVRITVGKSSMRIWVPGLWRKKLEDIEIPLPLKDGYSERSKNGIETKVALREDPDLGSVSTVIFRDPAEMALVEFTFSSRNGIIGWKQNIENTRWDWELVDSRVW